MDLLAGYDSGDESDGGGGSPGPPARAAQPAVASAPPAWAAGSSAGPPGGAGGGSLFSSLPAPRTPGPAGGTAGSRKVQWKVPIKAAALAAAAEAEEDGDRPKKKSKSTKGSSLASLLPAPKNVLGPGNGGTASLLGGGAAMGGTKIDALGPGSDTDWSQQPQQPAPAQQVNTNNLYRVDAHGNYGAEAYAAQPQAQPSHYAGEAAPPSRPSGPVQHYNYFPRDNQVATPYQGTLETLQGAGPREAPEGTEDDSPISLLQAELERERDRHARLGKKAGRAPKIVNITQEKLKYVAPQASAAANAATNTFGPQYQAQLRQEAGEKGSKSARRKHQIGTLFHNMKMAELEALETKTKSQKSKAETARKYGW